MKKMIMLFLFVGLLEACATNTASTTKKETQPKPAYPKYNVPSSPDKSIKGLEGCKKEFVFEVMGLPTAEKVIDNTKYLEWSIATKYYPENTEKTTCTIHVHINSEGIADKIYYNHVSNWGEEGCQTFHHQITRYYHTHPAQSPETCPNRTDLQGNHFNK